MSDHHDDHVDEGPLENEQGASSTLRELVQGAFEVLGPDQGAAVLSGAIVACEWIDTEGCRWFTWVTTDASGEPLASWTVRGLIEEVKEGLAIRALQRNLRDDEDDD